jgi:hypothetical protein
MYREGSQDAPTPPQTDDQAYRLAPATPGEFRGLRPPPPGYARVRAPSPASFTIAPGPNDTINKHVASGQYLNRSHYVETAIELLDTLLERRQAVRSTQRQPSKGVTP